MENQNILMLNLGELDYLINTLLDSLYFKLDSSNYEDKALTFITFLIYNISTKQIKEIKIETYNKLNKELHYLLNCISEKYSNDDKFLVIKTYFNQIIRITVGEVITLIKILIKKYKETRKRTQK